jgi:hypothetical protein
MSNNSIQKIIQVLHALYILRMASINQTTLTIPVIIPALNSPEYPGSSGVFPTLSNCRS